jgi:FixJ family two-component response regulator
MFLRVLHQRTIAGFTLPALISQQVNQSNQICVNENKICVAVVDDDESFARAIGRLLRATGFRTAVYHSAEAFLRERGIELVNCLVLDVQLGGMSGLDLGRRLLEMGAKTPVIFVTALEGGDASAEARQIGCAAYLHKPVSGQLLVETIHHAVNPSLGR